VCLKQGIGFIVPLSTSPAPAGRGGKSREDQKWRLRNVRKNVLQDKETRFVNTTYILCVGLKESSPRSLAAMISTYR